MNVSNITCQQNLTSPWVYLLPIVLYRVTLCRCTHMANLVQIHAHLYSSLVQVFYIIVQFSGLLPERVVIQRRRLDLTEHESGTITEEPWLDWQYMARNCNVFEMQNNGPLLRPDSVNCLQLPR